MKRYKKYSEICKRTFWFKLNIFVVSHTSTIIFLLNVNIVLKFNPFATNNVKQIGKRKNCQVKSHKYWQDICFIERFLLHENILKICLVEI